MERKITITRNKDSTVKVNLQMKYNQELNEIILSEDEAIQLGKHLIDMGTTDISEMSLTINDKEIK